eukprot:SAG11_NODE_147_length_14771_cov_3.279648_6_plen_249_part_00
MCTVRDSTQPLRPPHISGCRSSERNLSKRSPAKILAVTSRHRTCKVLTASHVLLIAAAHADFWPQIQNELVPPILRQVSSEPDFTTAGGWEYKWTPISGVTFEVFEVTDLELYDLDQDGDLDLLVASRGFNSLYLNNQGSLMRVEEGHFHIDRGNSQDIEVGDLDGDGHMDVVVANVRARSKFACVSSTYERACACALRHRWVPTRCTSVMHRLLATAFRQVRCARSDGAISRRRLIRAASSCSTSTM